MSCFFENENRQSLPSITRRKKAVIAGNLHPHYRETVDTVSRMSEHVTVMLPRAPEGERDIVSMIDSETSCVVVQTPDCYGHLHDLRPIAAKAHAVGALLIALPAHNTHHVRQMHRRVKASGRRLGSLGWTLVSTACGMLVPQRAEVLETR